MYAITFNKIDLVKDDIIELLGFYIGKTEKEALNVISKIKEHYLENEGEPEVVIDFYDDSNSIFDDYSLTYEDAKNLAYSMGWNIETNERI